MSGKHKKHWQQHPHGPEADWPREWSGRPGILFIWLLFTFGMMIMLLLGGVGGAVFLLTRLAEQSGNTAVLFTLSGCGLMLALPMLAWMVGTRTFRDVATVAAVMEAADKVADGDLSVRVPQRRQRNRVSRLARSFNDMTTALQSADEQRRNLTADVAHELRTPLHIIQGNLEGILDGVYEPTEEHINATLEETHMLARLVDDLHTLAQAEAGQLPLHLAKVDVAELLADVQTSFSGQAEAKGVELFVTCGHKPADLLIEGDTGRLDQVLTNLVTNALRHTPSGGMIELDATQVNGRVHIQVKDTGEGIRHEDLPYIFNRFWRGDRSRSRSDGSSGGLGLAIAKQLIEAHNGRIEVSSTSSQGTTFTIQLPLQQPITSNT